MRKEALALLEQQSLLGHINLLYGDESQVSEQGYVPYGWQFSDEDICIEAAKGGSINCFALISRSNKMIYRTTEQNITADFVVEQIEELSSSITKPTVVVLDNARHGMPEFILPAKSKNVAKTGKPEACISFICLLIRHISIWPNGFGKN